ncbi:hypothetical protein PAGA_a1427 [Pseudoalteromonas agarivorans DSM 14585]|uniref:Uncharacterized protein n=1 Tax=Pseudoalteromonas agarivorans DSM 14585 TaxID=1312369 RepID=A0ACA8DUZ8_9GAMM|nr:hypothetical protein PAGA_a1427 [Pseudoalteromonas agarivorans DSM 14585]
MRLFLSDIHKPNKLAQGDIIYVDVTFLRLALDHTIRAK